MAIVSKIKELVRKLQGLPEERKKLILWAIIVLFGLVFLGLWMKFSLKRFEGISKEEAFKPINDLIDKAKLSDESLDRIDEIQDNINEIKNLESLNQLETEAQANGE